MIVGTAGHIDHGKTTLVRALTGVETDRLKEEKARGISIDLGFAYWPCADDAIIGFVDVPGHESLVHNMLAGATGIDFVILVVAADDGVMPQTREHLAILDLLGLDRGIVAITKADLVDAARLAEVRAEIADLLRATGLEGAEIIPVSAVTGLGLDILKSSLMAGTKSRRLRSTEGAFRLAVDRSFVLPGLGLTVTGTVLSGVVSRDDEVVVSPAGLAARVRSLHALDRPAERGEAGQRCALVLSGAGLGKETVRRGAVVLAPELHAPTQRLDCQLRVLPSERRPVSQWFPVRVHHASAEVGGRVVLLHDCPLAPGETGLVQLVLDQPLAAASGDRFILRDTTSSRTIGGGRFLDLRAPERRRRSPERMSALAAHAVTDADAAVCRLLEPPTSVVDLTTFCRDRSMSTASAEAIAARLDLVVLPGLAGLHVMSAREWNDLTERLAVALDGFHASEPDLPGIALERLRVVGAPRLRSPLFLAVIARMVAQGLVVVDRAWVRRPGHEVRFTAEDERMWSAIVPLLADMERFRPPRVRDVARELKAEEARIRRLARLASRRGDVEEIAHDHFFLYDTVVEMADIARALAASDAPGFTVIQFRDKLDNGRKVAIQVLEFFDRHGLTMRRGDLRRINPHRADLFSSRQAGGGIGSGADGGVPSPVGRPDFKSGWGRQPASGGFDSHPPPPPSPERRSP